ncbi:cytochrome P450 [Mycobacteroides franklinii]|uniref:Cytochrome P450 n=1 Tax=Mycobacteroides franklinii TaxID=948102 RepID=A0A4R8RF55_9MYCO|nr:cytochrome P450 [Mycobacteroides franklinii]ORA56133.1 steroid C27-monooxygenase [Mycobacteroides franklinii]TDH18574.1 cytochrome P450 [Mycobacteroides franklinii]TDZ41113.1 Steroid C26-monooxygenase [Mycobacteroides franklinii]TDZ53478.1 Steroid C26-monooxygenase [Mycobacteroides franklinii]TDZ54423.1 Steroid C26-monooxygenase [Mycobacteroides franklinii]
MVQAQHPHLPDGIDFTDPELFVRGIPERELAELRRVAPVWWNRTPHGAAGFDDDGFWVVTKHKDVKEVSIRSDVFSSEANTSLPRYPVTAAREMIEASSHVVMLYMDPPRHTRLRQIISKGFTPRAIGRLREELNDRAQAIAKAAAQTQHGDFVEHVACELPLQALAGLLGTPLDEREKLFHWSNMLVGSEESEEDAQTARVELLTYAMHMAASKIAEPGDDICTALVNADVDGQKLSEDEFGFFVMMLAVAGNETTRNSITHGMRAFTQFPEQWELYKKERPETAADEIVRWATPVTSFQRTALQDTELGGVQIKKGQRVVMMYRSANFDEDVFPDPFIFDIMRTPNPHVGFGGTGEHYCVGANLARMTVNLMFNAIADHLPDLASAGEPERLRSGWLNGVKHWEVDFCPAGFGRAS